MSLITKPAGYVQAAPELTFSVYDAASGFVFDTNVLARAQVRAQQLAAETRTTHTVRRTYTGEVLHTYTFEANTIADDLMITDRRV